MTFGGGSKRFLHAAERLAREGQIPEITEAHVESERSLITRHRAFWLQHEEFVRGHPRLFGFAIWKPYIIDYHLETLPQGWGLIYLDAGCVINSTRSARQRLFEYERYAEQHGVWATRLDHGRWQRDHFPERAWTKEDLLYEVSAPESVRSSAQWQSGMMLFTPTAEVRSLVKNWGQLSIKNDYHFSSDAPSVRDNDTTFVEHRHDQSIFSVLAKTSGFEAVSDQTWFAPNWFEDGRDYPLWAARWRRGGRMTRLHPAYLYRSFRSPREG